MRGAERADSRLGGWGLAVSCRSRRPLVVAATADTALTTSGSQSQIGLFSHPFGKPMLNTGTSWYCANRSVNRTCQLL